MKERQRAAARARLEREMAARAEHAATRRKRRNTALAAAGAVVAVVAVVVILVNAVGGGGKGKAGARVVAQATNPPAQCAWTTNPGLKGASGIKKNPDLKDTGLPPKTAPRNGSRDMVMNTSQGTITIKLDVANAPCSAASMDFLANQKYFDGTTCHRLTTEGLYILQCGAPSGKGDGGPAYTYPHENLPTDQQPNYPAGVVAMANPSDPDSNGSQFFIVYQDTPGQIDPSTGQFQSALASNYSIIGTVSGGMDVVKKIADAGVAPDPKASPGTAPATDGAPKLPVKVNTVTVGPIVN